MTANIDYNKIFNEHLELLGVIDIKKSLANTSNEISDYLDYFFNIEKVHYPLCNEALGDVSKKLKRYIS